MATFKVLINGFTCMGKTWKKGNVFETYLELDKKAFKGIVERIDPASVLGFVPTHNPAARFTAPPPPQRKDLPEQRVDLPAVEPTPSVDVGEDVTAQFPRATPAGLLVNKKDNLYFVSDQEDPSQPLNPEGLRKTQVNVFIQKMSPAK